MESEDVLACLIQLEMEDEFFRVQIAKAIMMALRPVQNTGVKAKEEEEEDVIDTADPQFAEKFQGFINQPPDRATLRHMQPTNTIIQMG